MSRRIDDDVLALGSLEPDLCGIDGDVLVAFRLKRVHEVCPFKGEAPTLGDPLELFQFAPGQRTGVVEQPAHKSGFAMVHMADDYDLELFH